MSQSVVRPRLLQLLAFATLFLLLFPVSDASASGDPPQCFDAGPITLERGATFSFTAGQACIDPEGDPLTLILTDPPDHGTLEGPTGFGSYTYTAPTDYVGPDSLSGKANDGTSDSNVATLSFDIVEPVDDAPACFASLVGSAPPVGGRFTVEAGDVTPGSVSCSDPEGADLTFSVLDQPDHGSVTGLQEIPQFPGFESASFTYTSDADHRGDDQFTLRVSDGSNTTDAVVLVSVVEPANDPPLCFASLFPSLPGPDGRYPVEAGDGTQGGILCSDDEGADLSFSVLDGPEHGTLSPLQDALPVGEFQSASFTYTPDAAYRGEDEFAFRVSDGTNHADAVVKVNVVEPVNDPPACFASLFNAVLGPDGRFSVEDDGDASQASISCSDDEGADLTFGVRDSPDHGSLSPLQESPPFPGSTFQLATFTYTPTPAYRGPDEFTLRTSDGTHDVDTLVRVTVVEPVDDPPQCSASLSGGFPDGPIPVEAGEPSPGNMSCTDDERADLTFSVLAGPGHGTLSPLQEFPTMPSGELVSFTYTPDGAYRGADEFTLRASDGTNTVDRAIKVNVIEPVNDPPQCVASLSPQDPGPDGRYAIDAGAATQGTVSCTDDEGADLAFSVLAPPEHGTVSELQESPPFPGPTFQWATFTYTPDAAYRGPDEFTLRASDGNNTVDRAIKVNVVEPFDDPPQCFVPNPLVVEQGQTLTFTAHTACSDPEGRPLTLVITDQPDHGPPIRGPDQSGLFTYTAPGPPFTGADSFGVEISDGVNTITGTVNLLVTPFQNDPPQCEGGVEGVRQAESVLIIPVCFDADDQALSYVVTDEPERGSLTGDPANGGWTYTPNLGFTGSDSFSFRANDGEADSQVVAIQITVLPADRIALSPSEDTPEVGATHIVTATARDASGTPQAGKRVRWSIEGAGTAIAGEALTNAFGQVEISWNRSVAGTDQLHAYLDDNGDGVQDPGEPEEQARAHWRADSPVGPPDAGDPTASDGTPLPGVTVGEIIDPDDPGERYFTISRSQTTAAGVDPCPGVPESRAMNLPISVAINSGNGTVVVGSVELLQVASGADAGATPLTPPGVMEPSETDGSTYTFVLDCIRTGDLFVRYTVQENGNAQTFTVPIGGIVLIDPQGVVYDADIYDERVAAGDSPEQARTAAAIEGAIVTLQRKVGDDFVTVLSGDPGISPHVNPQPTGADGKYRWDVSAGTYRVLVEKNDYQSVTSQAATIPPPVLDLHIRLQPTPRDTTPPETMITAGPTGTTADPTPTVEFSSEPGSTFECRVDSAAFETCTSPHTTAALGNGSHTFEVRATDASGNTDPSPASRGFVVVTRGGGPPAGPCKGLTGHAQAKCRHDLRSARNCGKQKIAKRKSCARRARAIGTER